MLFFLNLGQCSTPILTLTDLFPLPYLDLRWCRPPVLFIFSPPAIRLEGLSFVVKQTCTGGPCLSLSGSALRQLALPAQTLIQLLVPLVGKRGGSCATGTFYTSHRSIMRIVSSFFSNWEVRVLHSKGNFTLRAHMTRAAGVELVHGERGLLCSFFPVVCEGMLRPHRIHF